MLVNWSNVKLNWRMSPLKPRSSSPVSSTGPELYIQAEELFRKNVDNFNLFPVVKDNLFLAFGLGDPVWLIYHSVI